METSVFNGTEHDSIIPVGGIAGSEAHERRAQAGRLPPPSSRCTAALKSTARHSAATMTIGQVAEMRLLAPRFTKNEMRRVYAALVAAIE